jgi:hypothetical protein
LDSDEVDRADALNEAGFTALVADGADPDLAVLDAAAEFLVANWHPRLGLVAYSPDAVEAAGSLLGARHEIDVVVVHGSALSVPLPPETGLVAHFPEETYTPDAQRYFEEAVASGAEVEVYVYEGRRRGFADPHSDSFSPTEAALAEQRTLDALGYHLS